MEEKRIGAKRISEISKKNLNDLNKGFIESANLVEWLAVDQLKLVQVFLKQNNRENYFSEIKKNIQSLKKQSVTIVCKEIGICFFQLSKKYNDKEIFSILTKAKSDSIRNWACYMIETDTEKTLKSKLNSIENLADDSHFGVREIAWISIRPSLAMNLYEGIQLLSKFAISKKENLRRFASEISRPRGVWCKHIDELKKNPELAISILEPLKSDSSKYVRDSVGNWLNDASKSNPGWVKKISNQWKSKSNTVETVYILNKGNRSIK